MKVYAIRSNGRIMKTEPTERRAILLLGRLRSEGHRYLDYKEVPADAPAVVRFPIWVRVRIVGPEMPVGVAAYRTWSQHIPHGGFSLPEIEIEGERYPVTGDGVVMGFHGGFAKVAPEDASRLYEAHRKAVAPFAWGRR